MKTGFSVRRHAGLAARAAAALLAEGHLVGFRDREAHPARSPGRAGGAGTLSGEQVGALLRDAESSHADVARCHERVMRYRLSQMFTKAAWENGVKAETTHERQHPGR